MSTRKITLFNTRGKNLEIIETDVMTWKDLKPLVKEKGFDTNSLLATESIYRNDLVLDEAILPDKDFTVFFRQKDTKAGNDYSNMSYKEYRKTIAEILQTDSSASDHFNSGKNYTNKSTDELRQLLSTYKPATQVKEEKVGNLVEAVKQTKEQVAPPSNLSYASLAKRALESFDVSSDEELEGRAEIALEEVSALVEYLESKGEKDSNLGLGGSGYSADTSEKEAELAARERDLDAREKALLPREEEARSKEEIAKELSEQAKQIGIK